jgi:hypothetical protein
MNAYVYILLADGSKMGVRTPSESELGISKDYPW